MFYWILFFLLMYFFVPDKYLVLGSNIGKFISEYIYIYITQHVFHNSFMIKKHVYDIEYAINCKIYRFRTKYRMGPSKYREFIDDKGNNISEMMFQYLGPNDDFHKCEYRPSDFNCKSITIIYQDNTKKTYDQDDIIQTELPDEFLSADEDILSDTDEDILSDIDEDDEILAASADEILSVSDN